MRGLEKQSGYLGASPVGYYIYYMLLFSLSYSILFGFPPSENQVCPDDLPTQPDWLEQQAWFLAALDAKFSQQADLIRDLLDVSQIGGGGSFCQGSHLAMRFARITLPAWGA